MVNLSTYTYSRPTKCWFKLIYAKRDCCDYKFDFSSLVRSTNLCLLVWCCRLVLPIVKTIHLACFMWTHSITLSIDFRFKECLLIANVKQLHSPLLILQHYSSLSSTPVGREITWELSCPLARQSLIDKAEAARLSNA